jgi:glutathione S-transferase
MLTLYTNPMSRGRMVRWALEEIGAPYETKIIAYGDEMKAPDYLAINPMGKVPALDHDGMIVTETAAIIAYLADAFPAANLAPTGPARGTYLRWFFFGAGALEAAIIDKVLGAEIPPERARMVGYGTLETALATLEQNLATSPYIAGENFTAADIYVGSQIFFYTRFKILPPSPVFKDYLARITARPAAQRAAEIDGPM